MRTLLFTSLLLLSSVSNACPEMTGRWVIEGNLDYGLGFVAVFAPDHADGKMYVTEHLSGYVNKYQIDRVSVGTSRERSSYSCKILLYSADEEIQIDGYFTSKFRIVGAASVRGASGSVVMKKVWL